MDTGTAPPLSPPKSPTPVWGRLTDSLAWPGIFFCLALLLRLPVLHAHLDTWYPFETHAGSIAIALNTGLPLRLADLPIASHIRGSVLFGFLLAPLFRVVEPDSFTLKLLPWLWHAITIALAVAVLRRYFSRAVAISAGLLLLLAPPMYVKLSVLGLASHMESSLLMLLALVPFYRITIDRRCTPANAGLFGLACGFAGFFHLQALLPCLVMAALLLLVALPDLIDEWRRLRPWRTLLALGGAAATAAPAWLFNGGSLDLLRASMLQGGPTARASTGGSAVAKVVGKVGDLLRGDFVAALEFGEAGGAVGLWLGRIYAIVLLLCTLTAIAHWRREFADLLRQVLRPWRRHPLAIRIAPFLLHALMLLVMMGASHVQNKAVVSAGAANRHLAPLVFSLLVLAGIGIGALLDARRRAWAALLLAALLVPGAIGTATAARSTEANSIPQRGECLELFASTVRLDLREAEMVARLSQADPGDPAFRTLRFNVGAPPPPYGPTMLRDAQNMRQRLGREEGLFCLTKAGRRLVAEQAVAETADKTSVILPDQLLTVFESEWFRNSTESMAEIERSAVLHGMGLALEPPRASETPAHIGRFLKRLERLGNGCSRHCSDLFLEGFGFGIGLVYDPYNRLMIEQVGRFGDLPAIQQEALARGLGWGYRQRYRHPPTDLPAGLAILDSLREPARLSFTAAFCGRVLPREARSRD